MPSALDVEQKLLAVLDKEADRLQIAVQDGGPLGEGDCMNLSYYLRAATASAKAELERIEKVDPDKLPEELLNRLLKLAGATPIKKAKRAAAG